MAVSGRGGAVRGGCGADAGDVVVVVGELSASAIEPTPSPA